MNSLPFGTDTHQYYETVASGSGAGDGFAGTDVVQTHMTNARLTDPEVLEWRYPVRLESYEMRPGTGGGRGSAGARGRRHRGAPPPPFPRTDDRDHAERPPAGTGLRDGRRPARCARAALDRATGRVVHQKAGVGFPERR